MSLLASYKQEAGEVQVISGPFHNEDNEEGFILVKQGNPMVVIGELSCIARPFDLFYFKTSEPYGVLDGDSTVIVFKGRFNGRYQDV